MNFLEETELPKMIVNLRITQDGITHQFNGVYEDDVEWSRILDHLVGTLESHYGYTFDLHWEQPAGTVGIYYPGKKDYAE